MPAAKQEELMHASHDYPRPRAERGPSIYYGYCDSERRYRLMDLPEFVSNVQQGMSRMMSDAQTAYQQMVQGLYGPATRQPDDVLRSWSPARTHRHDSECGCDEHRDCHCECCVSDADVLVHARCGELRRIPVTFENDSRRERQVKLELDKFVTRGGKDVKWATRLSESEFAIKPCGEHTVILSVGVLCENAGDEGGDTKPKQPNTPTANVAGAVTAERVNAVQDRIGSVDRCEVAYATLRAEGCSVRPAVIAVAVLPDDCDTYRRPCSCGCCH
jgi:hypothetical protein